VRFVGYLKRKHPAIWYIPGSRSNLSNSGPQATCNCRTLCCGTRRIV